MLKPVKGILGLKTSGVYKISKEYGAVCMTEIVHYIEEGKKHHRQLRPHHPERSAVEQQFNQPGAPGIL
jgi:hypothetical protein